MPGLEGLPGEKGDQGYPGEKGEVGPAIVGEKGLPGLPGWNIDSQVDRSYKMIKNEFQVKMDVMANSVSQEIKVIKAYQGFPEILVHVELLD